MQLHSSVYIFLTALTHMTADALYYYIQSNIWAHLYGYFLIFRVHGIVPLILWTFNISRFDKNIYTRYSNNSCRIYVIYIHIWYHSNAMQYISFFILTCFFKNFFSVVLRVKYLSLCRYHYSKNTHLDTV